MYTQSTDYDALYAGVFAIIILAMYAILFAIMITAYVVQAIPLYKMAKKMGRQHAWLAWIPVGNMYIMYAIPNKPFDLFKGKIHFEERYKAFIWSIAVTWGGAILVWIGSIFAYIPLIGILVLIGMYLIDIALYVFIFIMHYPMYKDIYDTFMPDKNNVAMAVLSLFVPIVAIVMLWIAASKEPVQYVEQSNYN